MAWQLHASRRIQVNEGDSDVDTSIDVRAGDTLIFQAWGSIWAGVWFTGNNGPRGWSNRDNDRKFPLPGAHPFQLLGKLDTGYFEVGYMLGLIRHQMPATFSSGSTMTCPAMATAHSSAN